VPTSYTAVLKLLHYTNTRLVLACIMNILRNKLEAET